ncbi:MAG: DNA polymerase III subunit [Gemmatimonadota bacterium]
MSGLPNLIGHDDVRASFASALSRNQLPGTLLIHGPAGIGKQRLALWLAQRIVCETSEKTEPCGVCVSCKAVLRLQHPDVHWFFPMQRPKVSGGSDRMADALEEARAEALEERRGNPFRATTPNETIGIYVAHIQTVRHLATTRPAMGRKKVFVIGDAEALVPQEASPEAANALLKILEEPPADTTFVLTAADPDALLPTIRSRVLPVRVRPLDVATVQQVLVDTIGADWKRAQLAAHLSEGSLGRALAFLPDDTEAGALEALRQQARELLEAATSSNPAPRLAAAHGLPPSGARGAFLDLLDFLALWVRDLAAAAEGAEDLIVNADSRTRLSALSKQLPGTSRGSAEALRQIEYVRGLTTFNINPQLALASLLRSVGRALRS